MVIYRPIALATIFSKIFEHVLLHRLYEFLKTSDNQFGFERGYSTMMPIILLKEFLRFYCDHGSTMFVCFLDASKAFDRVDYTILFRKLVTREVPAYILHLLWNWYGHHYARIQWAEILSDNFNIYNGVRQGGTYDPVCLQFTLMSCQCHCAYTQQK